MKKGWYDGRGISDGENRGRRIRRCPRVGEGCVGTYGGCMGGAVKEKNGG